MVSNHNLNFKVLGIIIQLENSFGNNTKNLNSHYKILRQQQKIPNLGIRRFNKIKRAFN